MKGFIQKAVACACCAAAAAAGGCYYDCVDPCYPMRYNYMARQEVNTAFAPQVQNGHVLDQTLWNYFFEPGSDRLSPLGLDRLAYLARRRPCPDPVLWLQTAQDVAYDPAHPEKMAEVRETLDLRREAAVKSFLVAQTAGYAKAPIPFTIKIHDPAEVGMSSVPVNFAVTQMYFRARGGLLTGGQGGNVSGGGGGMGMGMGMGSMMGSTGGANVVGGAPGGIGTGTGR